MKKTIALGETHFNKAAERARTMGQSLEEYVQNLIELDNSMDDEAGEQLMEDEKKELDRRYEAYLANPSIGRSWESVKASIQARLGL